MAVNGETWAAVGPKPIQGVGTYNNLVGTYGATSGRVTSLAAGAGVIYAGTAGGGVWKTTDGGVNWSPTTDDQVSLAIGGLAVDPTNQNVYAATGEDNRCGDCQNGQGFLKSANAGLTWTMGGQTGLLTGPVTVASGRIFVGTDQGLYWSVDSGNSWGPNSGFNQLTTTGKVDAVVADPAAPGHLWASVTEGCQGSGFIATSSDSGSTWSVQTRMSDFASMPPIERIAMAGVGGVLYAALAACASSTTTPKYSLGQFVAILKSIDGGNHWVVIQPTASNTLSDYFGNGGIYQGDYDNVIAVDPTNAQRAVFGGVTMLATSDGGGHFKDIAKPYTGGPVHPDIHAALYDGATLLVGTDGGVYSTSATDPGTNWSNLNATLAITTFYGGAALDANHIVGGAQDEGTSALLPGGPTPPAWRELIGSDGGNVSLDPNSSAMYAEIPFGGIYKGDTSFNDTSNWQLASPCAARGDPACSDPVDFTAPFAVNWTTTPPTIFTATNQVYRSKSGGIPPGPTSRSGSWSSISPDLTTQTRINTNGDWITAMAFQAPSTIVVGSYGGYVYLTQNATDAIPTWTSLTGSLPSFAPTLYTGRPWITSLAIAGNQVWVTIGSAGGYQRVARTPLPPGAPIWFWVDGSLPPGPVNTIALDPDSPETVYVGTDAGAFVCGDCMNVPPSGVIPWALMGSGMPNARIDALTMQHDVAGIVAFTHGRGAYTLRRRTAFSANPSSLDFGSGTVGTTGPSTTVMITASGVTASIAVSATVSGPNASDFSVQTGNFFIPNCQGMVRLLPESTCQLVLNFTPSGETTRIATLTVMDAQGGKLDIPLIGVGSHPVVALDKSTLDFGSINVGSTTQGQQVTVNNTGQGPLTVSQITLGPDFNLYTSNCGPVVRAGSSCWIIVTFSPTAQGTRTGTLSIYDNAAGSPQTVALTGFGTRPAVSLSTQSLSFPDTPDPLSVPGPTRPVTITNTGDGPLTFRGVSSSVPDFTAGGCSGPSLAPRQSCTFDVTFAPTQLGQRTGTLTITDDANPNTQTVTLGGKGIPAPFAQRSTSLLNWGLVNIRTMPPTQSVTLSNTGTAPLGNISVTIFATLSSQPSEYSQTNNCPVSLAVRQACTITVTFAPTRTGGDYAELHINDDAANSPQIVALEGEGADVGVLLQPNTLNFPDWVEGGRSPVQAVQLLKSGNGQLVINSIRSSTKDFTVTSNCETPNLNQGCALSITFTPTTTGPLSGSILVSDNATDGSSPQSVSVSGTGLAGPLLTASPSSLAFTFPPQSPGTTSTPKFITLTNTGQQTLNIPTVGFAQGGGYFTQTNTCASPIDVGKSCTVSVSFTPQSFGDASNYLLITDNAGNSPQSILLTGTTNLTLTSGPSVSSWGPGRLDVFALGSDGALWHKYYDASVSWQGWGTLGAPTGVTLTSNPSAVSWAKGRIDVFARGSDNALWHKFYDASSGGWSGWYTHGGTLTSAPSAASWGYGRLDIFAKGSANDLRHIFYSSTTGWSTWYSHGPSGMLTSGPGAVSWGYGRIDVFALGTANDVQHIYYDSSLGRWSTWYSHGGGSLGLTGSPGVSSWGPGRLDVFVSDSQGMPQHVYYDSTQAGWANAWSSLGLTSSADPGAVSWGPGRIDLFGIGFDNIVNHSYFAGGAWSYWYSG